VLTQDDYKLTASTTTDAEGHFAFGGIPAGKYPLSAAKRGYRTMFYDQHDDFNSAIVTGEGQKTDELVFRLAPGAVLRGVVTGDGGDAVENAEVMLFKRPTGGANGGRMEQVSNMQTDDTGAYEFSDLAEGDYLIAVKGEPWYAQHGSRSGPGSQEQSALDVAYPLTYYDSTTDEGAATAITLTWGSREHADINLHAVPALRLRLPAGNGRGTDRPRLMLHEKVFGNIVSADRVYAAEGPTGALELGGIAPGTYEAELGNPPRRITLNAASNMDLDPNAGTPNLSVAGSLVMAGGGAVPEDVGVVLTSVGEPQAPVQAEARRGQFEFNAVPPGTWSVNAASSKGTLAVLATSVGGVVTAGETFVVRDRPVTVMVMVTRAHTRVQGFARKGSKPAPGVMVVLVPREQAAYPALVRRDQSDSDGSFSLRDVPPGQYTAVAIEDAWKLDWQRREVIAPYLREGVAVTVTEQAGPVVSLGQPVMAEPLH
jgi:hypothetical protein